MALSLTPIPTTPAPEAPPVKALRFTLPPKVTQGRGWALWSYEVGGFAGMVPYAPEARHASLESCEADKTQRIANMADYLANVMGSSHPHQVSMTEHGWTQGTTVAMPEGMKGWGAARRTLLLCVPWHHDT